MELRRSARVIEGHHDRILRQSLIRRRGHVRFPQIRHRGTGHFFRWRSNRRYPDQGDDLFLVQKSHQAAVGLDQRQRLLQHALQQSVEVALAVDGLGDGGILLILP